MPPTTRRFCRKPDHNDMGPHRGDRCMVCDPDAPEPTKTPAPAAVPALEIFAPTALDVIRAAGDEGATMEDVLDAGADPRELLSLEVERLIETRHVGVLMMRGGYRLFFAVEKQGRAA